MTGAGWEEIRIAAVKLEKIRSRSPEAYREVQNHIGRLLEHSASIKEVPRETEKSNDSVP